MLKDQERRIAEVVDREGSRLRNFIRRRVADPRDVEDIVQDVFSELVEANRMLMPIDHVTGWLFRVARNRIIDLFRKKKPERLAEDGEELLLSPDAGPEDAYERSVLLDELEDAIDELPKEQRDVFIAHEIDGKSFKEIAAETGVNVNTLLSRKRYAVQYLRERLQGIYDDFTK
jgi:RNA polymerase sigma factor (sigma-70 family)